MSGHISRELRSTNKKNKKSSKTKNTERTRKVKKTTKKTHKTRNTEIETERVSQDLVQDSLQTSTSGNSNLVSNTERSILGEKDANEPQVLVDNVEQESRLEKISNDTNNKHSFIWNYLEKLPPTERYKKRVKCLVKISGQSCGHIMGSDGSTGNFIFHLAKHRITRDGDLSQQNNENVKETQNNSAKKNWLDKKFVGIIIKDDQPISIRNDEGFCEFVEELDPLYELPSNQKVRDLLVKSYNFCKEEIVHLFEQGIVSCSLTLDLWTSRSRAGYLGVTCSFVNSQFEFCEATLAIEYLKYPHTSENIVNCLNWIIGK